jgi:hypothetical protein
LSLASSMSKSKPSGAIESGTYLEMSIRLQLVPGIAIFVYIYR